MRFGPTVSREEYDAVMRPKVDIAYEDIGPWTATDDSGLCRERYADDHLRAVVWFRGSWLWEVHSMAGTPVRTNDPMRGCPDADTAMREADAELERMYPPAVGGTA
jgi:hypothetical protein